MSMPRSSLRSIKFPSDPVPMTGTNRRVAPSLTTLASSSAMFTEILVELAVSSSTTFRLKTIASGAEAVDGAATPTGMTSPASTSGSAIIITATVGRHLAVITPVSLPGGPVEPRPRGRQDRELGDTRLRPCPYRRAHRAVGRGRERPGQKFRPSGSPIARLLRRRHVRKRGVQRLDRPCGIVHRRGLGGQRSLIRIAPPPPAVQPEQVS